MIRRILGRALGAASADAAADHRRLMREHDEIKLAIGRLESRLVRAATYSSIREAEFKVFSQWGEDGIIQFLTSRVPIENKVFVEFGVESYREANTRFLLVNDHWRGLIMDQGDDHVSFLRGDRSGGLAWRHDIKALTATIDASNVDELIAGSGISGDIGFLSVDIDGNDYWVLRKITVVQPRILVVEYNSTFGPSLAVTIPYQPDFDRTRAHYSNLYWGASLAALCDAAAAMGHVFVGCNSAGNNAFFVRGDLAGDLPALTPAEGYVADSFRESRDRDGRLTYVSSHEERLRLIADMPLYDVRAERTASVAELFGLAR